MTDIIDVQDSIHHAVCKLAFVGDFFSQPLRQGHTPEFSDDGLFGLSLILKEIGDEINRGVKDLSAIRKEANP